eukprot:CAMPEP_0197571938 /NCGR_PEP_ID=MMETSP1320-20131121/42209_1 /TAXON_ID=91990 /ORGANISM="Bolidomonas sp., Strain RCC2347" /LENGTH=386 /DNA_ID=CAMNT_0043134439 /DNA_START=1042 /DNA_END=2198 /DNA_ORIENTATION=+
MADPATQMSSSSASASSGAGQVHQPTTHASFSMNSSAASSVTFSSLTKGQESSGREPLFPPSTVAVAPSSAPSTTTGTDTEQLQRDNLLGMRWATSADAVAFLQKEFTFSSLIRCPERNTAKKVLIVCECRVITSRTEKGYKGRAKMRPDWKGDGSPPPDGGPTRCGFQIPLTKLKQKQDGYVWCVKPTADYPLRTVHVNCAGVQRNTVKQLVTCKDVVNAATNSSRNFSDAMKTAARDNGFNPSPSTILRAKRELQGDKSAALKKSYQIMAAYRDEFNKIKGNGKVIVHYDDHDEQEDERHESTVILNEQVSKSLRGPSKRLQAKREVEAQSASTHQTPPLPTATVPPRTTTTTTSTTTTTTTTIMSAQQPTSAFHPGAPPSPSG